MPAAAPRTEPTETPPHGGSPSQASLRMQWLYAVSSDLIAASSFMGEEAYFEATFITTSTILSDIFVLPLYICIYIA